jgi:hypothetical protein
MEFRYAMFLRYVLEDFSNPFGNDVPPHVDVEVYPKTGDRLKPWDVSHRRHRNLAAADPALLLRHLLPILNASYHETTSTRICLLSP